MTSQPDQCATVSGDYVRFIILSGARTGSHMLAQALNSNPEITCFREVFNTQLGLVQFGVDGYDDLDPQDMALRQRDAVCFLRERIFCDYPQQVRAVGFKFHHGHHFGFPGVLDQLAKDKGLRVLDLQRRNILRMYVSLKLAQSTGSWIQEDPSRFSRAGASKMVSDPVRNARKMWRAVRSLGRSERGSRPRVEISPDELFQFIVRTRMRVSHYDGLFQEHSRLAVFYEDMVDQQEEVFGQAQEFLGVEPRSLTVRVRKQNPEPLRELIENYDELYEKYRGSPHEGMFESARGSSERRGE